MRVSGGRVSVGGGAGSVLGAQLEGGGRSGGHGPLQRLNLTVGEKGKSVRSTSTELLPLILQPVRPVHNYTAANVEGRFLDLI